MGRIAQGQAPPPAIGGRTQDRVSLVQPSRQRADQRRSELRRVHADQQRWPVRLEKRGVGECGVQPLAQATAALRKDVPSGRSRVVTVHDEDPPGGRAAIHSRQCVGQGGPGDQRGLDRSTRWTEPSLDLSRHRLLGDHE